MPISQEPLKDELTLYAFDSAWGLFDLNPFCMKVEAFMRFADIPHAVIYHDHQQPLSSGPWPYVYRGNERIEDSSDIIDYLIAIFALSRDKGMTAQQQGIALLLQRTLEEHLYPIMLFSRLCDPEAFPIFKQTVLTPEKGHHEQSIAAMLGRMRTMMSGRGLPLSDPERIYQRGLADVTAVAAQIPDEGCIFGPAPGRVDALVFAFLANILALPLTNPMKTYLSQHSAVQRYYESIHTRYFAT